MSTNKKYFQVLGCGHSESIIHYNNNALVSSEQGKMLIDCGHTIKHALHEQGLTFKDIDAIFITHVHGDHVFGLERAAYETKFTYNKKIKLIFHESIYQELWDQTLKGSLGVHGDGEANLEDYFEIETLNTNHFECLGNSYEIFPVSHTPNKPTFGLCLNEQIFYSSDTIAIAKVIAEQNFKIGFHDVTLTEENPVHATLASLIKSYPYEARKKLYLMSYQDNWQDFKDTVEREFKGFAKQGMKILYE